jgi:hypothetical protein
MHSKLKLDTKHYCWVGVMHSSSRMKFNRNKAKILTMDQKSYLFKYRKNDVVWLPICEQYLGE